MSTGEVPKGDSRKPDPSEPWRFVCPECERQVFGHHSTCRYYTCDGCGRSYLKRELKDKKGRIHTESKKS